METTDRTRQVENIDSQPSTPELQAQRAQIVADQAAADKKVADEEAAKAKVAAGGCSVSWGFSVKNCFESILAGVGNLMLMIASRILWIAGLLMDLSVSYGINMGKILIDIPIVTVGWRIIRDLINVSFIFVLIYAGIRLILGLDSGVKKTLVNIVLAALLMNFSLFFTKVIIDAGNIATIHFYNLMGTDDKGNRSISAAYMEGLRIQTAYETNGGNPAYAIGGTTPTKLDPVTTNGMNIFLIAIFGSILMVVTAFTFAAAAILFLIRTVFLLILLMTSPVGFIFGVVPLLGSYTSKWWKNLMGQVFFAPAYMVLAYIVVYTIQQPTFQTFIKQGSFAQAFTGTQPGAIGVIFSFVVLIAIQVAALKLASDMGAVGGKMALSVGSDMRKNIQGRFARGVIRGTGLNALNKSLKEKPFMNNWAGRAILDNTTGKLINAKWGSSKSIKDVDDKKKKDKTEIAAKTREFSNQDVIERGITTTHPGPAPAVGTSPDEHKAQLDAHNAEKAKLQAVYSSMSGKQLEDIDKKHLSAHAEYLSTGQLEHLSGEKNEKWTEAEKKALIDKKFKTTTDALEAAKKSNPLGLTPDQKSAIHKLSIKELELNPDLINDSTFIEALSASQLEDVLKSGKITEVQKQNARTARFNPVKEAIKTINDASSSPIAVAAAKKIISSLSEKEVELLDESITSDPLFIQSASGSQLEAILKNKNTTGAERATITNARIEPITTDLAINNGPAALIKIKALKNPKTISGLDQNILTDTNLLPLYDQRFLTQLATAGEMEMNKRDAIRNAIITHATTPNITVPQNMTDLANWLDYGPGKDIF